MIASYPDVLAKKLNRIISKARKLYRNVTDEEFAAQVDILVEIERKKANIAHPGGKNEKNVWKKPKSKTDRAFTPWAASVRGIPAIFVKCSLFSAK